MWVLQSFCCYQQRFFFFDSFSTFSHIFFVLVFEHFEFRSSTSNSLVFNLSDDHATVHRYIAFRDISQAHNLRRPSGSTQESVQRRGHYTMLESCAEKQSRFNAVNELPYEGLRMEIPEYDLNINRMYM